MEKGKQVREPRTKLHTPTALPQVELLDAGVVDAAKLLKVPEIQLTRSGSSQPRAALASWDTTMYLLTDRQYGMNMKMERTC